MKILANIIWFIFGGFFIGMTWIILGLLLCLTIIGIPFGKQCFKAAGLTFMPFGKTVECNFDRYPIVNIIWVLLIGWEMALGYLFSGLLCCVTIIGIPLGLQSFKMMKLAFLPFGAIVKKR